MSQLPAKRQVVDANAFDAYGPSHGWSGDRAAALLAVPKAATEPF